MAAGFASTTIPTQPSSSRIFSANSMVQRAPQEPMAFVAFGPPTRDEINAFGHTTPTIAS